MIRTLTPADFEAVFAAFADAFSDYVVKLSPTREQLAEMLTRRGYLPEASVGMFDDGRLVAFTLNGVDGERAYDSGTGVVLSHRRRGLGRRIMEASMDVLRERGCASYVLEVIDANAPAVELYRGLGFRETRGLQCWSLTAEAVKAATAVAALRTAWQNSDASVARAKDAHVVLGDERGSVILFPGNGDLAQLRGMVDSALLKEAATIAGKPLRIMNVDERDREMAAFLEVAGATKTVRQLEMMAEFVLSPGREAAPHDAEQHPGSGGR
ncbi:MAG TPA: GNAT family N-acetyltransferase [Thermoanaerobaculia bacterium]|nr:GNAT family N-acetyltransferase [Thermoanaerobaculia bacterium]